MLEGGGEGERMQNGSLSNKRTNLIIREVNHHDALVQMILFNSLCSIVDNTLTQSHCSSIHFWSNFDHWAVASNLLITK